MPRQATGSVAGACACTRSCANIISCGWTNIANAASPDRTKTGNGKKKQRETAAQGGDLTSATISHLCAYDAGRCSE